MLRHLRKLIPVRALTKMQAVWTAAVDNYEELQDWLRISWKGEYFASGVANLSFLFLMASMFSHHGSEMTTGPFGITLTGFIGFETWVITTLLSFVLASGLSQLKWNRLTPINASMRLDVLSMFDEAGSNPWGFLPLLWNVPSSGAVWLAFLAAICIPIGSYTSGLAVQYGVKDVLVASGDMRYKGPYLPVVTNYSSHDFVDPSMPIVQAWVAGLYSSPGIDLMGSLDLSCGTGTCSWPYASTMAICDMCTEQDDEIEWRHVDDMQPRVPSFRSVHLRDKAYFNATFEDLTTGRREIAHWRRSGFTLLNASIMYRTFRDGTQQDPSARECILYLCAQLVDTNMRNGFIKQKIPNRFPDSLQELRDANTAVNEGPITRADWYVLQHRHQHAVHWKSLLALKNLFPAGNIGGIQGTPKGSLHDPGKTDLSMFILRAFGKSAPKGDVPDLFRRIALVMSNVMRSEVKHSEHWLSDPSGYWEGLMLRSITYFDIQWWTFVPTVLALVCSDWFLIKVVKQYRLTGATLWKGHPLAILVADADVSARSKTCSDANALTKRSEETEVRLKEDSGVRVMRIHQAAGGQTTAASADGSPSGG